VTRRHSRPIRVGYGDPPYLGQGRRLYAKHHSRAAQYDQVGTHATLIRRLADEFPDGWALSLTSTSLQVLLPLCPPKVRVAAWVKPFARFRPNVRPAHAWEPVIFAGGRKPARNAPLTRDRLACNPSQQTGLQGSKPREFCFWLFALLNLQPGDELVDLFQGTGAVTRCWREFCGGAQ
jgi:hypothetical protein